MRRPQKTCAICEIRRAGRRLQGRAHPVPVPDRAGQDPAQPALGHLRPAPAAAQHRHQAGSAAGAAAVHQGLRRLTSRPAGAEHRDWAPRGSSGHSGRCLPAAGPAGASSSDRSPGCCSSAGPGTVREWLWLLAAATWSALWLQQAGGLAGQFARAGGGAAHRQHSWRSRCGGPRTRLSRALLATAVGGVALVVWMWRLGRRLVRGS